MSESREENRPLLEKIKKSTPSLLNVNSLERDIARFITFAQTVHSKTKKASENNERLSVARKELKDFLATARDMYLEALQTEKAVDVRHIRKTHREKLTELDREKRSYKDAVKHARVENYPETYVDDMEDARWVIIEERIAERTKLDGIKSRESILVEIFAGPIKKIHKLVLNDFKHYQNDVAEKNGSQQPSKRQQQYEDLMKDLSDQGLDKKVAGMERERRQTNGHKKPKNRDTAYNALLGVYDDIIKILQRKVDSPSR